MSSDEPVLRLRSEFAVISASVDRDGNGDRLRLFCEPAGLELFLDPLQIEALARLPESTLEEILEHIRIDAPEELGGGQKRGTS